MYTENQTTEIASQDKNTSYAAIIHLSSFLGILIPFAGILAPLILWLIKKNEDTFVDKHGKSCLNFEISLFLYSFIIAFIAIITILVIGISSFSSFALNHQGDLSEESIIGIALSSATGVIFLLFLSIAFFIFYIIVKIIAAVRASNGELYRYPLAISFFR